MTAEYGSHEEGRGFLFSAPTAEGILARLTPFAAGFYTIDCVGVVDSTNSIAKEYAAKGGSPGRVIIAEGQTAGRGRMGRSFYSSGGRGLYLSIVLKPAGKLAQPRLITTAAALAVCRAVFEVAGIRPGIKWVNDVLIDDKKICGILTEGSMSSAGGELSRAVLGIGINLAEPEGGFPPELAGAGAVYFAKQKPPADLPQQMAGAVLNSFAKLYIAPTADENVIIREYTALCTTPGRRVTVMDGQQSRQALALRLDRELRLVVRFEDGTEKALSCGGFSVLPERI